MYTTEESSEKDSMVCISNLETYILAHNSKGTMKTRVNESPIQAVIYNKSNISQLEILAEWIYSQTSLLKYSYPSPFLRNKYKTFFESLSDGQ
jgi:hypothetical protein